MLTVYGIETWVDMLIICVKMLQLQQCLPFTVLKQSISFKLEVSYPHKVATVLTVYGIETSRISLTVLNAGTVATVLTVYGIETLLLFCLRLLFTIRLQQCLPFTVLKRYFKECKNRLITKVATVLIVYGIETSLITPSIQSRMFNAVATVLTVCGIETYVVRNMVCLYYLVATVLTACGIETHRSALVVALHNTDCCNSAYRLRY